MNRFKRDFTDRMKDVLEDDQMAEENLYFSLQKEDFPKIAEKINELEEEKGREFPVLKYILARRVNELLKKIKEKGISL